jgi:hypothetical protein
MHDLPRDNPEDPGLPDVSGSAPRGEFHDWQPQLLTETFVPTAYPLEQVLTAKDLNLYFDTHKYAHSEGKESLNPARLRRAWGLLSQSVQFRRKKRAKSLSDRGK